MLRARTDQTIRDLIQEMTPAERYECRINKGTAFPRDVFQTVSFCVMPFNGIAVASCEGLAWLRLSNTQPGFLWGRFCDGVAS